MNYEIRLFEGQDYEVKFTSDSLALCVRYIEKYLRKSAFFARCRIYDRGKGLYVSRWL